MPAIRFGDAPGAKSFSPIKAKFFRVSTKQHTKAGFELHSSPRLSGWPAKTNFSHDQISKDDQQLSDDLIIDPLSIVDLTGKLNADGRLQGSLPPGDWTVLRIGHTCTGTKTAGAPDAAYSLEIDKFSKEAVDHYFKSFLGNLLNKLRSFAPKTFKGVLIDSWEVGKQNWSQNFAGEFRRRKNYDIVQWLPALTGRIVKSIEHTEKIFMGCQENTC